MKIKSNGYIKPTFVDTPACFINVVKDDAIAELEELNTKGWSYRGDTTIWLQKQLDYDYLL